MNLNEIKEIRKRFRPDDDNIHRIYGCYVNAAKEIVTKIDMSLGLMEQDERELYYNLLKKTISGTIDKNLIDLEFTTAQVEHSPEHKLLQDLRKCHLQDENLRDTLYQKIIDNLAFEEQSYVILLAADTYDVPFKGSDDEFFGDGSNEVFDYFVCCVCPVKDAKSALRYESAEKAFRGSSTGHILSAPQLGFMFPTFDERSTNLYNLLYYSRSASDLHYEFIQGVFNIENLPMSAPAQKEAFSDCLSLSLQDACSLEIVQAVHSDICEKIAIHKESKEPETPEIYIDDVNDILYKNGIPDDVIDTFNENCKASLGDTETFNPNNIMESKKFELVTPEVKITTDPQYAYRIKTEVIEGRKYIMIPADTDVTVNGITINIADIPDD